MFPFPYFRNFVWGTPTIPDIYWNAYSYEERIKKLCMEYAKLVAFLDAMVDTVNKQYVIIEEISDKLPELITKEIEENPEVQASVKAAIDEYIESLVKGTTYSDINVHGFIHDTEE